MTTYIPTIQIPKKALTVAAFALASTACALLLLILSGHLDALYAAAGAGVKNGAIRGVKELVDKLGGNLVWLGLTSAIVMIPLIGIMFGFGMRDAQTLAGKSAFGFVILVSATGIVA